MGPAPMISTRSARANPVRCTPCRTQESGSTKAADVKGSAPTLKTAFSGAAASSAMPPGRVTPTPFQFAQKFWRFDRQAGQLSQAMFGSTATWSPMAKRVTFSPIFFTIPENSCPGMTGYVPRYSPWKMWTSVPQIPLALTWISTSCSPMTGSGTVFTTMLPGFSMTAAFMSACSFLLPSQPFTAPSVSPFTRAFCVIHPRMMAGRTAIVVDAESCATNIPCCSRNRAR